MWLLREKGAHRDRLPVEKLAVHARFERWSPNLIGDPTPPRRRVLTPIQEAQVHQQVTDWLSKGVVEPVPIPPLINNLVLASKKDGRIRVCIDCTPANCVTEGLEWPLPRIQDMRYRIRGNTWFTRIDLKDAFFRISVPQEFRHLVTFLSKGKAYRFRKMPFGLKTAPSTFQRFMDWGLSTFGEWAVWYQDDILIMAETLRDLRERTRILLAQLKEMRCEVNEKKSEYEVRTTTYAGLQLFGAGVGPDLSKLAELLEIPAPQNKVEAQSALGLVSYLRDFIPLAGHFTAMLYPDKEGLRLPLPEVKLLWDKLMRHLRVAATTTRHWKQGVDCDLYTDASGYAVGVVLLQEGRAVAVASRKLTPAETRYSATDREHLGLVFAAKKFKLFLHQDGSSTRVWNDHAALVTRRTDDLTPKQARWHTYVQAWMPNVRHVAGKLNPADFVSRWRVDGLGANF